MPPRDSELPEGTDHIINGAMSTGAGAGASTGSSAGGTAGGTTGTGGTAGGATMGGTTGTTGGGGSSSGFIGAGAGTDDTGGTAARGSRGSDTGGGSGGSGGGTTSKIAGQVRDQVQSLTGQATDKVRQFADQGKDRATGALDNFSQVVQDAARSVDERLGQEYGQYAHRAADAVSSLADTLRDKSVDDLLDDTRAVIRKSPGIAIGAAALIGFALARVVKAGMPSEDRDVNFTPDPQLTDRTGTTGGTTTSGSTGSRSTTGTGGGSSTMGTGV